MQAQIRYVYKLSFESALDLILENDKYNVTNETCPDDNILSEMQKVILSNVKPTNEYDEWFAQGYVDILNDEANLNLKYNPSMSSYVTQSVFVDIEKEKVAEMLVALLDCNRNILKGAMITVSGQDHNADGWLDIIKYENVGYANADSDDELEADRYNTLDWFEKTFETDLPALLVGDIILCYIALKKDMLDNIASFLDDLSYDVSELNTDDECASQYDTQSWEKCLKYINSHWSFNPDIYCTPSMFFYYLEQNYYWKDGEFVIGEVHESLKERLTRLIGEEQC